MPSSEQIRESIEARIDELRNEMTSLEAARGALHTNGASRVRSKSGVARGAVSKPKRRRPPSVATEASATPGQSDPATAPPASTPAAATKTEPEPAARSRKLRRPAGSRRATRRKPVAVLVAGKLEAILRDAEDGLNAVAIAKQINARDTQVRDLLRELEGAGQVRRTGGGRASRWTLITDEERIAERTAELEAVSTPKP